MDDDHMHSPTSSPIITPEISPVKKKQKVDKAVYAMTMFSAKCRALIVGNFISKETSKLLIKGKEKWNSVDESGVSTHMILSHFNRIDLRDLFKGKMEEYMDFLFQSVQKSKGKLAINETAFTGKLNGYFFLIIIILVNNPKKSFQ
jgi:hypothetical protein